MFNPQPMKGYPVSALGRVLGRAADQHHVNTQIGIELIAPMALGAAAIAVQDLFDVQRPNSPPSPTSLYICVVAGSGEGKDFGLAPFIRPIQKFQAALEQEHQASRDEFEAKLQAWKVKGAVVRSRLAAAIQEDKATASLQNELAEHQARKPKPELSPVLLYEDATPAAIAYQLCNRWPSGALVHMEAGGFFQAARVEFWNARWSGQPIITDTISRGHAESPEPRLSKILGIQPDFLAKIVQRRGSEVFHGSGYSARLLLAAPASTIGTRFINEVAKSTECLDDCSDRITELLHISAQNRKSGGSERERLSFTPSAQKALVDHYNRMQALAAPGNIYCRIVGYAAKATEQVARVSAILHVMDDLGAQITDECVERAILLVQWHTDQFLMLFGQDIAATGAARDAAELEQVLVHAHRCGHWSVAEGDLRFWSTRLHGRRLSNALALLAAQGRAQIWRAGRSVHVRANFTWALPMQ